MLAPLPARVSVRTPSEGRTADGLCVPHGSTPVGRHPCENAARSAAAPRSAQALELTVQSSRPREFRCVHRGVPVGDWGTNCWVVASGAGEQCVIIDPGVGVGSTARRDPHRAPAPPGRGHADPRPHRPHLLGAAGVPGPRRAGLHPPADRPPADRPVVVARAVPGAALPGLPQLTFAEPDDVRELADGSTITLAGLPFAIRHTPGHTAGSVVFELSDDDEQRFCSPVTCCSPARSAGSTCPAARWMRCCIR